MGNSLARLDVVHLSWDSRHELRWWAETPDFAFDITVRGAYLAPFFDEMFPGANPDGRDGYSYSHTEQLVRGEGTVRDRSGTTHAFSGFGWRDRGWGRRINELAFGTGYDLVGGILPDGSAFALTGMRNVEHPSGAPLPLYGFLTDSDDDASPAVGGIFYKDSLCYPTRLGLEFANGRRVDGEFVRHVSTLSVPFHDAQPEVFGIAVNARDYYSLLVDPEGREFAVFSNEGHGLRSDVTTGGRFFHALGIDVPAG